LSRGWPAGRVEGVLMGFWPGRGGRLWS
jgi:hypothetical protein